MLTAKDQLVEVFKDAAMHKEVAAIIASHLSNSCDIREKSLEGIDLEGCREVLDLGCGYGFFTSRLAEKLPAGARITGIDRYDEYHQHYLNCTHQPGISLSFFGDGIGMLNNYSPESIDLVICSYALYFFPDAMEQIARVLKKGSRLIAITHAQPHMHEFTSFVRGILERNGYEACDELPYEELISHFSDRTGPGILVPWFSEIITKPYQSYLVFDQGDEEAFSTYFDFKKKFFLPETCMANSVITDLIKAEVNEMLIAGEELRISKDDVIYICTRPE